jgi:signal transduction histidine kinase
MGSAPLAKSACPGLALFCDLRGALIEVVQDDWKFFDAAQPGTRFTDLVDEGSFEKATNFFSMITAHGVVFDWELHLDAGNRISKMHFSGVQTEKGVWVIGSSSRSGLCRIFERIASEQGSITGHPLSAANSSLEMEDAAYSELSRLNNDLVNAQRELAKKTAELEESRFQLERRIEERTQGLNDALSRLRAEIEVRTEAEERLRELSANLLRLQDDERRRVARDLHDTTGQTLSALKMTLSSLQATVGKGAPADSLFVDLHSLAEQALKEIRTTSYLLHPPMLDEAGFASAARWFVQGLAERWHIDIELKLEAEDRMPEPIEMALFRVLQESLTNVIRHSGTNKAVVHFTCGEEAILSVRDYGKGIRSEQIEQFNLTGRGVGVGLSGMRERARELGGKLDIHSDETGTTVAVTIPLAAQSRNSAPKAATHSA